MKTEIRQALARGYCSESNKNKELDSDLIEAMVEEIFPLVAINKDALDALFFCINIAEEELGYAEVGTGSEVVLRHISRKCNEAIDKIQKGPNRQALDNHKEGL